MAGWVFVRERVFRLLRRGLVSLYQTLIYPLISILEEKSWIYWYLLGKVVCYLWGRVTWMALTPSSHVKCSSKPFSQQYNLQKCPKVMWRVRLCSMFIWHGSKPAKILPPHDPLCVVEVSGNPPIQNKNSLFYLNEALFRAKTMPHRFKWWFLLRGGYGKQLKSFKTKDYWKNY